MRIDFGGGEGTKEGYKSCDILEFADYVCDFENDKLPFKDNSIKKAFCNHTLEHIRNNRHFLNELHRVLRGEIKIIVPYGLHPLSCKPVHVNMITECWFDFLRKKSSWRIYGYKTWELIDGTFNFKKDKQGKIYEMSVIMKPIK